jgi:centrosomal protein CEP110
MKPKFDKLTAVVKGYLTRRLLNTEKIQNIIETIRDTVELLLRLYEENPANAQGLTEIKQEDQNLHHRLVQQVIIFFYII